MTQRTGDAHRTATVVTVVLVAVAVVLALTLAASRRSVTTYRRDTPQGTVQAWFDALAEERRSDALALLTPALQTACTSTLSAANPLPRIASVVLLSTRLEGDMAVVRVAVTETYDDGLLGANDSTIDVSVVLTHVAGATSDGTDGTTARWLISEPPWPFAGCLLRPGAS